MWREPFIFGRYYNRMRFKEKYPIWPKKIMKKKRKKKIHNSELYCKIHNIRLIDIKHIININCLIEIGYCKKCNKEYCEYSDISPIYISNYEWLYEA